ncbi:hypothetical protein [Haloarcula sediminis]|uniref:hypothetical protein n=1 Tax=Haloarcula sediminis TaxID=3111777 RepID=UPI002D78FEC2|nr:hypothetical protein [Haloarcula sp. CK38]
MSDADNTDYEALLESLTADPAWVRSSTSPTIGDAARAATGKGVGEVFLQHRFSDATLSIAVPHHRPGYVARLLLDHTLDDSFPHADDGFVGRLYESEAALVESYQTQYLEPVVDTSLICRARIPEGYSRQAVHATTLALSASALRVQVLHDRVEAPVEAILGDDSHRK